MAEFSCDMPRKFFGLLLAICVTLEYTTATNDTKYKISVFTVDRANADTRAKVYITLFAENGDSGRKNLDDPKGKFERNKADTFVIKSPRLGRLKSIRIGHDNSSYYPGWFLDKVIIDDCDNSTTYTFTCNRWLSITDGDGKIELDLNASIGATEAFTACEAKSYKIELGHARGKYEAETILNLTAFTPATWSPSSKGPYRHIRIKANPQNQTLKICELQVNGNPLPPRTPPFRLFTGVASRILLSVQSPLWKAR